MVAPPSVQKISAFTETGMVYLSMWQAIPKGLRWWMCVRRVLQTTIE